MSSAWRVVAGLAVVAALSVGVGLPAGAGNGEVATLTVTKTVDGVAPDGAEYVIRVDCAAHTPPSDQIVPDGQSPTVRQPGEVLEPPFVLDLTFDGPGSQDVLIGGRSTCTVTETDNGGADSNTGPVTVDIAEPIEYSAEIVNTFEEEPTTTTTSTTTTTTTLATTAPTAAAAPAAAAPAQAAQPTFTG